MKTSIELFRPQAQDVPELARICFEAFGQLHDRHSALRDFTDLETAEKVIGLFVSRADIYGIAAKVDGRLAGSNFMSLMDATAGVGPITVDPAAQGRGVGKALMQAVLDEAKRRGIDQVRLVQEALNTVSSPVYTALGFDVREPLALMTIQPAIEPDPSVRPATHTDVTILDQLSRNIYKTSRLNELRIWPPLGFPLLVRERAGSIRGYFIPGNLGHGVFETVEDALALIGEMGRRVPPQFARFLCPMRNAALYRGCLRSGHRLQKVLTLMTFGSYTEPEGCWLPSYLY